MLRVTVVLEKGSGVSWLHGEAHQKTVKPYSCIDLRLDALSKEERGKVLAMVAGNSMIYVRTTDDGEVLDFGLDDVTEREKRDVTKMLEKLDEVLEGLNVSQVVTKLDEMLEKLENVDVTRVENLDNIEEEGGIDIRKYFIFCVIAFAGGYTLGRFGNKASFTVGCQFLAATNLKAINEFFKPTIKSGFEVFKKEVGRTLNKLSLS